MNPLTSEIIPEHLRHRMVYCWSKPTPSVDKKFIALSKNPKNIVLFHLLSPLASIRLNSGGHRPQFAHSGTILVVSNFMAYLIYNPS